MKSSLLSLHFWSRQRMFWLYHIPGWVFVTLILYAYTSHMNKRGGHLPDSFDDEYEEAVYYIMDDPYGPVYPITDTSILILSGSYMGEVMDYSPDSGIILHQNTAFLPLNE